MSAKLEDLNKYILASTTRGECKCGQCIDAKPDPGAPPHSVNVHFFWVAPLAHSTKEELLALLEAGYPDLERLRDGPSYIEIGATLGSQDLALRLIGLGKLVGLWDVVTPESMGIEDEETVKHFAGQGMVMCTGLGANA